MENQKKEEVLRAIRQEELRLQEIQAELNRRKEGWAVEPVDVLTFFREFLKRPLLSAPQKQVLAATCGIEAREFSTRYIEVVAMVGQKGGKNFLFEGLTAYILYKLCCLHSPREFFGVPFDKWIAITNSSLKNERQAREVFFDSIKHIIEHTIDPATGDPWFERYAGVRFSRRGDQYSDVKKKVITIPQKGVRIHSFDSTPDAPEGLLIFLGIIDEPSRASTPQRYAGAKKLWRVVGRNALGSFKRYSKTILFSYPEQELNDLIVERYRYSQTEEGRADVFGIKSPTWIFNPTLTREMLEPKFKEDPIGAACAYGCDIPENVFGFFRPHMGKIKECALSTLGSRVTYRSSLTQRVVEGYERPLDFTGLELVEVKGDARTRIFAGDPSKVEDAFVISGGYLAKIGLEFKMVVDIIIRLAPARADCPIDYLDVENAILELVRYFPNIVGWYFDQYNSESLRQKILMAGVKCETLSFSRNQQLAYYKKLREVIWNNRIEYLYNERLLKELKELLLINQLKIDHPDGGSKDIADTFAIIAFKLSELIEQGKVFLGTDDVDEQKLIEEYKRVVAELRRQNKPVTRSVIAEHLKVGEDTVLVLEDLMDGALYEDVSPLPDLLQGMDITDI